MILRRCRRTSSNRRGRTTPGRCCLLRSQRYHLRSRFRLRLPRRRSSLRPSRNQSGTPRGILLDRRRRTPEVCNDAVVDWAVDLQRDALRRGSLASSRREGERWWKQRLQNAEVSSRENRTNGRPEKETKEVDSPLMFAVTTAPSPAGWAMLPVEDPGVPSTRTARFTASPAARVIPTRDVPEVSLQVRPMVWPETELEASQLKPPFVGAMGQHSERFVGFNVQPPAKRALDGRAPAPVQEIDQDRTHEGWTIRRRRESRSYSNARRQSKQSSPG